MRFIRTKGETTRGAIILDITNEKLAEKIVVMIVNNPEQLTHKLLKDKLPNLLLWQFNFVFDDLMKTKRIMYVDDKKLVVKQ